MEHPKLKEICASHVIEFACFLDLNFQSCDFIDVNNFITGAKEGGKGEGGRGKGEGEGEGGRGKGEGERGKGKGEGGRGKGKGGRGKAEGGRGRGEGERGKGKGEGGRGRVDTAPQNLSPDYALIYIYIRTVMKTVEVHTM